MQADFAKVTLEIDTAAKAVSGETYLTEHKLELALTLLRSGCPIRLRALGSSMLPSIWPGDILTIEKVSAENIHPGSIVFTCHDSQATIHRLLRKDGTRCITRGDSMPQNDPPLVVSGILGRVSEIQRGSSTWEPQRTLPVPAQILAAIIAHSDWCRSLALRLGSRWLSAKRNEFRFVSELGERI